MMMMMMMMMICLDLRQYKTPRDYQSCSKQRLKCNFSNKTSKTLIKSMLSTSLVKNLEQR